MIEIHILYKSYINFVKAVESVHHIEVNLQSSAHRRIKRWVHICTVTQVKADTNACDWREITSDWLLGLPNRLSGTHFPLEHLQRHLHYICTLHILSELLLEYSCTKATI